MATLPEERAASMQLFSWLESGSEGHLKSARDALDTFTRLKVREDGIHRRLMDFKQIENADLARSLNELPQMIVDKEPDGAPSVSTPLAALPISVWINAPRYQVLFGRVVTPRMTKEIDQLRTWVMDIRSVIADNAIKDLLYEEDRAFFSTLNFVLGGAADQPSPLGGSIQWRTVNGGLGRDGIAEAKKVLPAAPGNLNVMTFLINSVSIFEIEKWGRDEMGGDLSQDIVKDGFSRKRFMDTDWVVTIKKDLVPNDTLYHFGPENFIGKAYMLEDTTMAIKREFFFLDWFAYEYYGCTIANAYALGATTHV